MFQEIPDSHFWSNLDMMINYFKITPDIDKHHVIVGLENMKKQGYKIIKVSKKKKAKKKPDLVLKAQQYRDKLNKMFSEVESLNQRVKTLENQNSD
jgi:hypothetical protein